MPEQNGWNEYSKLVLDKIEQHDKCYQQLDERVRKLAIRVAVFTGASGVIQVIVIILLREVMK